jgi:bacterioferritin (cytochrome b1)
LSYVQFEGEDKYDLRKMLENDLRAEQQLIPRIRERIDFARENRDHGIDDLLKDILEGHEKIAHELHHYLQEQSLEKTLESISISILSINSIFMTRRALKAMC